jgi:DIS3-like exonuclease 2
VDTYSWRGRSFFLVLLAGCFNTQCSCTNYPAITRELTGLFFVLFLCEYTARLDYATAQNIIENKVATGENNNETDEELWPKSRRPTGGHTMEQVAADVRLMNIVAKARRLLRFQHGAVALSSIKLVFQLDEDRETPLLCQPYAIRDSNRLIEEYMLLANFLVAQRLITHAGGLACLRNHEPPLPDGLEKVQQVAQEAMGFHIDISSSEGLQKSLNRLGRECKDVLILQCVTEMLKTPLKPANYVAAGEIPEQSWAHFALNIPYYTHFTSPIRRYADVMVHRLLQATLDGEEAVQNFPYEMKEIGQICGRCNDKKDASRKAQERSSVVFLALYLRRNPLKSQLGVVLSVGEKAFTVFLPDLGIQQLVYLEEHKDWIESESFEVRNAGRHIKLTRVAGHHNGEQWKEMLIKVFAKVRVTCVCKDKPPISVKLMLEGPWTGDD